MTLGRRDFVTILGGAAATWPLAARAQQGDRVRRIGVLWPTDENDPEGKRRHSAFVQALADLGWTDDRNVRTDVRGYGDAFCRGYQLMQQLQPFWANFQPQSGDAGKIPARPCQTPDESSLDRIVRDGKHDRNRVRRSLCRKRG